MLLKTLKAVALRKESVDRNAMNPKKNTVAVTSLSARRAWIEMHCVEEVSGDTWVALRKESVDRNGVLRSSRVGQNASLSARRAWIEITVQYCY